MLNRIQPLELAIPDDEPFANDRLSRLIPARALENIVTSVVGPCVLSVDGRWGTGKTTFLKMWAQHLRNSGRPVVEFNAWETDFSQDPFLALVTEIEESLDRQQVELPTPKATTFWKNASKVMFFLSNTVVNAIPGVSLDIRSLVDEDAPSAIDQISQQRRFGYAEARRSIKDFRDSLADVFGDGEDRIGPLVVIVDELDRCRPTYAIEVLETAKHLFSADGVVFVLGMNREQLAHSVQCVYGQEMDAAGYLARFVDIEYTLPPAPRGAFLNDLIKRLELDRAFSTTGDGASEQIVELFLADEENLSLRDAAQAIHRLALMMTSCNWRGPFESQIATALLVCRVLNPTAYRDLIDRRRSDDEVLSDLLSSAWLTEHERISQRYKTVGYFEAIIIAAFGNVTGIGSAKRFKSPRYERYLKEISSSTSSTSAASNAADSARRELVVRSVDGLRLESDAIAGINLPEIVERIELYSMQFAVGPRSETSN